MTRWSRRVTRRSKRELEAAIEEVAGDGSASATVDVVWRDPATGDLVDRADDPADRPDATADEDDAGPDPEPEPQAVDGADREVAAGDADLESDLDDLGVDADVVVVITEHVVMSRARAEEEGREILGPAENAPAGRDVVRVAWEGS